VLDCVGRAEQLRHDIAQQTVAGIVVTGLSTQPGVVLQRGGATPFARPRAAKLGERQGQTVVIENKPN